jgi:hypothetical protein
MAGPAIQAIGIAWTGAHLLVSHLHEPLTPRHVVFDAPFLVIFVGFLVSIVCIPVALEVARASEDDVAMPDFEPEDAGAPERRLTSRQRSSLRR